MLILSMVFTSCAHRKEMARRNTVMITVTADGSSFERAIFITETQETPGIHAEYAWIKDKYPGYKLRSQSLSYYNRKPYDIIHITTADGTDRDIYFDISNFYGKF